MTSGAATSDTQLKTRKAAHPLSSPAKFKVWNTDKLRLTDVDHQHHVNNAIFAVLYTSGRHDFIQRYLRPHVAETDMFAMARITIDYLAEMHYPGEVKVGTLIRRVGNSSITFGHGMFKDNECVSVAEAVMVLLDPVTRRAKPFPRETSALLAPYIYRDD